MRRFRHAPTVLFLAALLLAAGWSGPLRRRRTCRAACAVLGRGRGSRLVESRCCAGPAGTAGTRSGSGPAPSSTARWSSAGGRPRGRPMPGHNADPRASPLPAERHAPRNRERATGRSATARRRLLIFTSLSVPAASWRQWARDAATAGAPLVLRGVGAGGLPGTVKRIGERLGGAKAGPGSKFGAGIAIDPRLFRLFGVTRVPAVVVVPGGVPPCESRGCAEDPPPPHDVVAGNIGLVAALEAVAGEGDAGRETREGLARTPWEGAMTARAESAERAGEPAARLGADDGGLRVPAVDRLRRGRAGGRPKAEARAIGNAGAAAAGAIARDAANAGRGAGLCRHGPARAEHRRRQSRRRRARPSCRSRRSGRRGGPRGGRGRDRPARAAGRGRRSRRRAWQGHRGQSGEPHPPGRRARIGQRHGLRRGPGGRRGRRVLRLRALVRGRRLRDRRAAGQHRVRRGDDAAQHGAGAGRRGVRPREP